MFTDTGKSHNSNYDLYNSRQDLSSSQKELDLAFQTGSGSSNYEVFNLVTETKFTQFGGNLTSTGSAFMDKDKGYHWDDSTGSTAHFYTFSYTSTTHYANHGQSIAYELHPGEDVFDGATWEMFLDACGQHEAARINYDPSHFLLQQMDYLAFIDLYHDRISAFHVKDAEFNPDGRQGVYSGYQPWVDRAGRFRSLGDGQIDFPAIFSKLSQYGYDSWAVLEWECCLKSPAQGAKEGAPFIEQHLIEMTDKAFDDFAGGTRDEGAIKAMLGL